MGTIGEPAVGRTRPADDRDASGTLLYVTERTRVRRVRAPDGSGNLIRKEPVGPESVKRVRHERAMLERLAGVDGLPSLVVGAGGDEALVMSDTDSRPLADSPMPMPLAETVELAVRLTTTVAAIHRRGVVHKDLNPSNILLRADGSPVLIDFDLATTSAEERPGFVHQNAIAGTLAYLAPEQTGRTGRPVDHRADLYSLGATLYQLAVGQPPFGHGEPFRLVHDHLARIPTAPAQANPAVPPGLSQLILRLLEKEPDCRYQSADGLLHDLTLLRDALGAGSDLDPAALGARDFPLRLSPPSRLVGRRIEIDALARAFADAQVGRCRGVLLAGAPGVGKSALVDELRPVVTAAGGWFVAGKFEQLRRDGDADAFRQAVARLGRLLLAEPDADLARHRQRLLDLLGPNAELAATVPELATLLHVAPGYPTGEPIEVAARLVRTGMDILRAIASPSRPVVVVLDDLQWATGFPVALLDSFLTVEPVDGLLLVGTYRDGEIDAAHPLAAVLPRWEREGVLAPTLHLENLPTTSVGRLLETMLRLPTGDAADLAEAVSRRTAGNPYDTIELLNALRNDGVLIPGGSGWTWDSATVRGHIGDGDVIDLLAARLAQLPGPTGELLDVLAGLGGAVSTGVLAVAAGVDPGAVEALLGPAAEEGLAVLADGETVRFRHDRVQEAACTRLDDERLRHLHLAVARRLAAEPGQEPVAAQQYLPVVDHIADDAERRQVAGLLRSAARRARTIAAATAETFLRAAIGLLEGPSDAADDDDTMLGLEADHHQVLYSLGRLAEADGVYRSIEQRCTGPTALVGPACVQVSSLVNRGRAPEAMALGLDLLTQLGVHRPADMPAAVAAGLDRVSRWVADQRERPDQRPPVTDPDTWARARLLSHLRVPAFISDKVVYAWAAVESQRIWTEEGPCAPLVASMSAIPALFIGLLQDHDAAYEASQLVMAQGTRLGLTNETATARIAHATMVAHWHDPLEVGVEHARAAREDLLREGDVQFACLSFTASTVNLLDCASTLDTTSAEMDAGLALAHRTGNDLTTATIAAMRSTARDLRGDTGGEIDDVPADGIARQAAVQADPVITAHVHVYQGLSATIFGDTQRLAAHADAAYHLLPAVAGFYIQALTWFLRALSLAERARRATGPEREELLADLDTSRDWLAARAAAAPANFGHLARLIDAERAWARGNRWEAVTAFDRALRFSDVHPRPWHAALATERAARFHGAHGLPRTEHGLLAEARDRYEHWGATAKVAQLERDHPPLRSVPMPTTQVAPSTTRLSSDVIDLMAVLQASQALSSETNLERLRQRVVEVLTSMTGATRVRVLLWNDDAGGWFLPPADGEHGAPIPVDDAGGTGLVPLSIFRYVERTREPLLVPDATADDRFARDPYLAAFEHCSLLVVPILSQGAPRAMLLLENELSRGVFTAGRLDSVLLIAGQLSVSLDNALAERFRSLVQRSSDGTLVCDRNGSISYVSTASTAVLGRDADELRGRSVIGLVHEDDRAALQDRVLAGARADDDRTPVPDPMECRVRTPEGERWVEITFTDLFADPAVGGLVLHLREVTERRRLEAELRHAQKLESVGQLAAGIAHEINTPIQFIGDNVRFLQGAFTDVDTVIDAYRAVDGAEDPDAARREAADRAEGADWDFLTDEIPRAIAETLDGVQRVATIVRAMKSFGHPGEDAKTSADLNEAVRNTLVVANSELKPVADVVTDLGDLPLVRCNLGDINQVLLNLVVNAGHAIGEAVAQGAGRGTVTVRTRLQGDEVVLEVHDTGVGIPDEIADRVFEQFFTTKKVGVGTGQGLALAYSLVHDHHDGTLTFTSHRGVGTTFVVRLPVGAAGAPAGEGPVVVD